MKKVLVAMSGGVDSSFAVFKLKKNGFNCTGVTLILSGLGLQKNSLEFVKQAANLSCVEHIVLNYANEFQNDVILNFIKSYEQGLTPNPCVWCNELFKFGKLLNYALNEGFDFLATGHYAVVKFSQKKQRFCLKKAVDLSKDQSYFLYFLNQKKLSKLLFPLGNLHKKNVKQITKNLKLQCANESESQDICFISKKLYGRYADFIKFITKKTYCRGNFVDEFGIILGEHDGIVNYTVGQRKGLKLALKQPMYVKKINYLNNEVVLAPKQSLLTKKIKLSNVSFVFYENLKHKINVLVKLRYGKSEFKATVTPLNFTNVEVELETPQIMPAKGQVVVFYFDDEVVGGGVVV